jgi:hypothetical protein
MAKEPAIHSTGSVTLALNAAFDLDQGMVVNNTNSDIRFAADRSIAPLNGAKLLRIGTSAPGAAGCNAANMTTNPIPATQLQAGVHFCVLTVGTGTGSGRLSDVRVVSPAVSIGLQFTTYVARQIRVFDDFTSPFIENPGFRSLCGITLDC